MLAELAAANAAFQILKQTVQNGKDLMSAGKAIGSLVEAEDKLRNKGFKKKNSFWFKVGGGGDGSDLEEFMALEEIKRKKAELESAMRLYGRPGLYDDWVRFQVQARKDRAAAEEQREENMQRLLEVLAVGAFCVLGLAVFLMILYFAVGAEGM